MANKAFSEIGATGLNSFSGQVIDDFLREWRGKEAYKRADEMRKNSPIVSALLLANEQAIRKVTWDFVSDDGENDPRLELLNEARDGMSLSWNDHVTEVLTMLPFGFSIFEIVYKRDDRNRIVWRKFAPRGQDTVYRWQFDDTGGVAGIEQQAAPTFQLVSIPIERLIVYRTRVERGNPEGRSILRASWIPYYYAKNIQQIEAIGIERDLAGLPWLKLPPGADTADNDNSDLGKAEKIVRNVRNDEQAGIVTPDGWEFALVSTGGSRQFDTDKIIRRYESRILMSALAQFLNLGQEAVGSLALSKDQTDFFTMSVNAVADNIADTFTKYAIPRLLQLNGFDSDGVRLEHSPAGDTDVDMLVNVLQKVGSMLTWTPDDEVWLRGALGMPEIEPEAIAEERANKMAQAIQIAQQSKAQQPPQDKQAQDKQPPQDQPPATDNNSVITFAANAPDDAKRRRYERQMERVVADHLAKTKRRVMKEAKVMKGNYGSGDAQRGTLEALQSMVLALVDRPTTPNISVTVPPPPAIHITNQVQPTPVEVKNEITVQPSDVVIDKGTRTATVKRDSMGRITEIRSNED